MKILRPLLFVVSILAFFVIGEAFENRRAPLPVASIPVVIASDAPLSAVGCSPAANQALVTAGTPFLVDGCKELVGLVDKNGADAGAVCSTLIGLVGPEISKLLGSLGKGEVPTHFVPLVVDGKAIGFIRSDLATEGTARAQAVAGAAK